MHLHQEFANRAIHVLMTENANHIRNRKEIWR